MKDIPLDELYKKVNGLQIRYYAEKINEVFDSIVLAQPGKPWVIKPMPDQLDRLSKYIGVRAYRADFCFIESDPLHQNYTLRDKTILMKILATRTYSYKQYLFHNGGGSLLQPSCPYA
jgi:hypothetical protein